jgi:hypothetical protein
LACLLILIGNEENGWWKSTGLYNGEYNYLEVYPISMYFITSTLSTVGYGEFVPGTSIEIIIVMILELLGLAVFSYVLGVLSSIRGQKSIHRIITKKQENIEQFLNDLNEARKDVDIPLEVYVDSIKTIGATYKYNVKYLFSMFGFFEHMKPITRKRLVLITLQDIYVQFKDFFWNEHLEFQAKDRFIIQFITEFESKIFLPGKVLLERGEQCEHLYFIAKGSVLVMNHKDGDVIARLPRFSFFGDYQIFLDARSNVSYQACIDEDVVCYIIHKDKFFHLLQLHNNHIEFFMKRAITTRRMFKRLVLKSHIVIVRFTFLNLV